MAFSLVSRSVGVALAATLAAIIPASLPIPAVGSGKAQAQSDVSAPKRIVSLNLCADQLVLALADRDQIAGLTRHAADPGMSAAAGLAKGLPLLGGSAEAVMAAKPDLLIGMPARRNSAISVLKEGKYKTVDLKTAKSYDEILVSIRTVAAAVGHPERGEALIQRMNADLAALPKASRGQVGAYYQRRGFLTGGGTLIDDLMARSGLVNLATKLGRPALSQLSLEELAAARPHYLIVDSTSLRVADQGTEMLQHPVLRGIPRIGIPQAWTVCGGPAYVQAAAAIASAVKPH